MIFSVHLRKRISVDNYSIVNLKKMDVKNLIVYKKILK